MATAKPLTHVSPPAQLKLKENPIEEWKLFKQMYSNYSIITELGKHDKAYQKAVFLHSMGPAGVKIFNTLTFSGEDDKDDIALITQKLDQYIIGEVNETYERYVFNKRDQEATETFEAYLSGLRTLAKTCNFCDCLQDSLLRDRIVLGIRDSNTRKLLLQKRSLTLKMALDICRSAEATTNQLKSFGETETEAVHKVTDKKSKKDSSKSNRDSAKPTRKLPTITCKFCARKHLRKKELCPAWGKTCSICKRDNHFKQCCKYNKEKRKVHALDDYYMSDSDDSTDPSDTESINCVGILNAVGDVKGALFAEMMLEGKALKFQIDSGATVNVLPKKYVPKATILPHNLTLKMYNQSTLRALGKTKIVLRNPTNKKKYRVEFVVIEPDSFIPLLSRNAAERMSLITVNYDNFKLLHSVNLTHTENIIAEYNDVFKGKQPGSLPGVVHLHIAEDAKPVQCSAKKIPVSLKHKVKTGLAQLVKDGILAPVDEPTQWCSRMAVTEKKNSNDLRYCIDPRPLNKVLQRELYELPVMEDILPELSRAKVFSKLDLRSGYLHCVLDEQSSLLTTMMTPFGRYRWKRLPFGLKVSSEIFQKRLIQAFADLEGVECVADDILIFGVGDTAEEAEQSHNARLKQLLQRCRANGIKLNGEKSEIKSTSINFMGHVVTSEGLKIDTKKVEAITKMSNPTNPVEVQRLQGSVTYLAKFLPRLSTVFEPIRKLTRKDTEWQWTEEHDKAMADLKKLVTSAPILAYYDPKKTITIQCDASKTGLGATIMQEGKPLAYASRALTPTEQRYAQIEKEALAIVFALERFHQYTFGHKIRVESDHKPLETIVKKPLHRAPRRLQGMLMRMLNYNIEIIWKKGTEMHLADMLSRAYLPYTDGSDDFAQVNLVDCLSIGPDRLRQIKAETDKDESLQLLKVVIQQGWPDEKHSLPSQTLPYFNIRDELSIHDGLVFRGERIIVPYSLRVEMMKTVHSSHLGVESSLRRARECLYWPGISAEIKQFVSKCEACRSYETKNQKETLMPHDLPHRPWEKIGIDLFEYDGKDYLVTVDYLSNFLEIDRLHDLTSKTVIKKLKAHFARYGIPNSVISDNGGQFTSDDFKKFSKAWDFEHFTISPKHSQSNGKVESAVKAAKRLLKKCKKAKSDPYMALLELRNTPTQGLGTSPAQRLHSRRTRTLLPTSNSLLVPRGADILNRERSQMKHLQKKQTDNYNRHAKDLPTLAEGDVVRLKPFRPGEKQWAKAVVNKRLDERSYEIEAQDGTTLRRNRVDLKKTCEDPPVMLSHTNARHHACHTRSQPPQRTRKQPISPQTRCPTPNLPEPEESEATKRPTHMPNMGELTEHHQPAVPNPAKETIELKDLPRTRSGRLIKEPSNLKDYVKY